MMFMAYATQVGGPPQTNGARLIFYDYDSGNAAKTENGLEYGPEAERKVFGPDHGITCTIEVGEPRKAL